MLKLKDVIWEITLKCGKGCKYCGSKSELRSTNPPVNRMLHIAKEIGSYGVEVVTLSGGEPGEIDDNDLTSVINDLKILYHCDVRAITNGKLLGKSKATSRLNIIGLSVNYPDDFLKPTYISKVPYKNIVMVTNFGTHNIWEFDKLAEIAQSFKSWQIQLTTGSDFLLNPAGISYLKKKIRDLKGVKYILADNLQDQHTCSAGMVSCGITADGEVIPCLSERTSGFVSVQGNLFERSLKDIWENEFKEIRFGSDVWPKSCRNCIKYPEIKEMTPSIAPIEKVSPKKEDVVSKFNKIVDEAMTGPRRYRGCSGGNVMSYGVTDWNIVGLSSHDEEEWK